MTRGRRKNGMSENNEEKEEEEEEEEGKNRKFVLEVRLKETEEARND